MCLVKRRSALLMDSLIVEARYIDKRRSVLLRDSLIVGARYFVDRS